MGPLTAMLARLIALFGIALTLSACDEGAGPPASTATPVRALVANVVSVDITDFTGIRGRVIERAPLEVANDITVAVQDVFSGPGAANANIALRLKDVLLPSPGSAFAFGGPSSIRADVTVTDAQTGAVIFGPEEVRGTSATLRVPGLIGVATSPSASRDYAQTVAGFAVALETALSAPVQTPNGA